ncbi:hypothetical protein RFI_19392 [Reticulomyxa filosa]|uniref:Uncharacterized protein n=1 Tax=Reticulomyxa filosa TaxID=46433 RepID=X6MVB0_RETFI|nr:hypothetical protein RFI_19392 [Reticulomyxa filosa]|eukprot:ETO17913.1 hypothetical protein RFI_19392 [Reticulomyxa filosa]
MKILLQTNRNRRLWNGVSNGLRLRPSLCWLSTFKMRGMCTSKDQLSENAMKKPDVSPRQRFEVNLRDLLTRENIPEQEFTDIEIPPAVLNELTKEYSLPLLPRVGYKELEEYIALIKARPNATEMVQVLNKYSEQLLSKYFCIDDDILNCYFREFVHKDVNKVDLSDTKSEAKSNESSAKQDKDKEKEQIKASYREIVNEKSDELLLSALRQDALCTVNALTKNELYELGMIFYDISISSVEWAQNSSVRTQNRIAAIFLALSAQLEHATAQCKFLFYVFILFANKHWRALEYEHEVNGGVDSAIGKAAHVGIWRGTKSHICTRAFLGSMYMRGYGLKKNLRRAYDLLNESSRLGNAQGQCYLAEMYEKGVQGNPRGEDKEFKLEKDYFIALRLSEQAAGRGAEKLKKKVYNPQFVIEAATIAGRMYCLQNSFIQALPFFEQAAILGDVDAQCNLGHIYHVGLFF